MSGIIPADAGSTSCGALTIPGSRDHPRGCGEHATRALSDLSVDGSSPRMRGARSFRGKGRHHPGIIPADAGSTISGAIAGIGSGDYPRGCGEHGLYPLDGREELGSSPRMRGARAAVRRLAEDAWIIPADAGSTWPLRSDSRPPWDHPRGCGEHAVAVLAVFGLTGSSPRMRGAR